MKVEIYRQAFSLLISFEIKNIVSSCNSDSEIQHAECHAVHEMFHFEDGVRITSFNIQRIQ